MNIPAIISERRAATKLRVDQIAEELNRKGAVTIAGDSSCIYATGSVGRGEVSSQSDLDVFIVRDMTVSPPLSNLEGIRLKARLIEASRSVGFPEFSRDGLFLKAFDVNSDLLKKLGSSNEDHENVLTARLLLLLESRPLIGNVAYDRCIGQILGKYWTDYPDNQSSFIPAFLINDILRFWKTLCLNYEERTGNSKKEEGERRLHNYKLKHSRMLTCYSAIIYLMAIYKTSEGTVSLDAAEAMVKLTPTERLEFVAGRVPESTGVIDKLLAGYASFLATTDAEKTALAKQFEDPAFKKARFAEARLFGDAVFDLLHTLGEKTKLLRYIVV